MDIVLAALCGFLMDLALGDPASDASPGGGHGGNASPRLNAAAPRFSQNAPGELAAGAVLAALLAGHAGLAAGAFGCAALRTWRCALRWRPWCWQALAMRGLRDESRNVYRALTGGTLSRRAPPWPASRRTPPPFRRRRDESGRKRWLENFADGVAAPMFCMLLGGRWRCATAVNTMDSMVGYKNERYLYFARGRKAGRRGHHRPPARLRCCWRAAALTGQTARRAAHLAAGQAAMPAPPAQTEAVMAGALGVQLAGPASYFGKLYEKPTIGDALRPVEPGTSCGQTDAVCRRDAVHGAAGLRALRVPAAGAVTEGEKRKELTHGGDWAGYAAQYGGMPLDFSANVSLAGFAAGRAAGCGAGAGRSGPLPDPLCRALRKKLSGTLRAAAEHFVRQRRGGPDLPAGAGGKPKRALVTVSPLPNTSRPRSSRAVRRTAFSCGGRRLRRHRKRCWNALSRG
ncbi:MAG: cobalamin biosynthesis protein [Ruthenibacterium lactatiformans]